MGWPSLRTAPLRRGANGSAKRFVCLWLVRGRGRSWISVSWSPSSEWEIPVWCSFSGSASMFLNPVSFLAIFPSELLSVLSYEPSASAVPSGSTHPAARPPHGRGLGRWVREAPRLLWGPSAQRVRKTTSVSETSLRDCPYGAFLYHPPPPQRKHAGGERWPRQKQEPHSLWLDFESWRCHWHAVIESLCTRLLSSGKCALLSELWRHGPWDVRIPATPPPRPVPCASAHPVGGRVQTQLPCEHFPEASGMRERQGQAREGGRGGSQPRRCDIKPARASQNHSAGCSAPGHSRRDLPELLTLRAIFPGKEWQAFASWILASFCCLSIKICPLRH